MLSSGVCAKADWLQEASMARAKTRKKYPGRKISETFLDFASPLLEPLGPEATEQEMEHALKIAFTVWNAVVYDAVDRSSRWIDRLRNTWAARIRGPGRHRTTRRPQAKIVRQRQPADRGVSTLPPARRTSPPRRGSRPTPSPAEKAAPLNPPGSGKAAEAPRPQSHSKAAHQGLMVIR